MPNEEQVDDMPSLAMMKMHNERFDAAIAGLARANVAGIAACLAASFQNVPVAFPLGCFLLGGLGYGLHKAGELLGFGEVIAHYVREGTTSAQQTGLRWISAIEGNKIDMRKLEWWSLYLDSIGILSCAGFFLVGVIAGFLTVAL